MGVRSRLTSSRKTGFRSMESVSRSTGRTKIFSNASAKPKNLSETPGRNGGKKICDEIRIRFLRVEITAHCRTKDVQPTHAEFPECLRHRVAVFLDEVNHVWILSQRNIAVQFVAGTVNFHAINAASQSFQTGS